MGKPKNTRIFTDADLMKALTDLELLTINVWIERVEKGEDPTYSNIASRMGVAEATIKKRFEKIKSKLHCAGKVQLFDVAKKGGL